MELREPVLGTAVAVDGRTGRPREIRAGGQRLAITALEAIRDEILPIPWTWGRDGLRSPLGRAALSTRAPAR